ncbi:Cellulose biosynthesis protein BcsQ [Ferrimonas marina]|uniref:Cellulose biosynthesis protein BcsQ n=1 Tax=Ferrimonas marina TaxID=299255 RepID=A0A1M5TGP7_9GAMM|nr:Cellulose biosynthesis protein BcsQ [Ferrimonas marina]
MDRVAGEVGRVMAVLGPKGGAGKTTLTTTSGVYAAKMGFKVVLVDFDPQGSTTEQTFGEGEELLYDIVQSGKENIGTLLWPEQEGEKKMSDKEYSDFLDSELEQYFLRLTSWPNLRVIAASRGMESLMVPRPGYPVVYSTDLIRRINMIARKLKDDLGYDYIVMDTPPSFTNIPGLSVMSADTITIAANPDGWNFSSIAEFCLINRQQVEAFMKQNVLEEGADVISTKLVITNFDSGHNDKTVVGDMEKLFKKNEYHKPYMLRSQCVKAAHENRLNIFELPVKHSEVFGTKASVSRAIENCEDLFMGIFKEGIEELWPSFSRLGHDGKKTGKNGKYPG